MKRRKSTVLTSLIVTIAMVMSMGGYLFADETETEVIPEEPAVEETAEAPEDIEEPEVAETEEEIESPAEASEDETSDEDIPVEESAEEAPAADEIAEDDENSEDIYELTLDSDFNFDFDFDYDNDELAEQYINSVMSVTHQRSSVSSYDYVSNGFTPGEQAAFGCLYSHVRNIANGVESNTQITIPDDVFYYTQSELGVSELKFGSELSTAISKKIQSSFYLFTSGLLYSCPYELYWYDKTSSTSIDDDISYKISDGKVWLSMTYLFPVSVDYRGNNNYEVNTSYGTSVSNAANNARMIINRYAGLDDYNKLLAYNNQICLLTEYNWHAVENPTPYGNPWQLVWVFDGDPETKVVCEGYSKAFQFLCDNSVFISPDVYAISVSGIMYDSPDDTSGGGHMWNIVHMDDGNNYLVDVTNSDVNGVGTTGDRLFMVGATMNQDIYYVHVYNGEYCDPEYSDYGYKYDSLMNNVFTAEALQLSSTAYVPGSDVDDLPAFCGHALSLSGQIGLQFFVELPDGAKASDYYVTFLDEHGHVNSSRPYDLSESNKVDSGIYMIQLNLSSIQMAEQITPKLHNRTTGDVVQGASYSVQDYINWGISATNTVTTPDEKALLIALANYGYYAQRYLSTVPGHTWTLGEDYTTMTLNNPATYNYDFIKGKTGATPITSTGTDQYFSKVTFALKFGDQVSLILYFTPVGDIDTNGFTVNGNPVTPELQADGRYRITIPNISVTQIGTIFTVKYGDATVTVSPVNYINAMLNQEGNTDGKNLVCALYELGVACGMN